MARLILGVTGSVAAIRTPALFDALSAPGHDVRVVATGPALYFFDPTDLGRSGKQVAAPAGRSGEVGAESVPAGPLLVDRDEWPGNRYQRNDPVLHIELRKWADLLIVAPLDANTLAKFALGTSDNLLTCLFRAWDFSRPVILAPAMNTLMWESPITLRHLRVILEDRASGPVPSGWKLDDAPAVFARIAPSIILVPPQAKRLACGDFGTGAMAEVPQIAEVVRRWSGDRDTIEE
jgi:phosphopantothenoylcysteine decarboxylase